MNARQADRTIRYSVPACGILAGIHEFRCSDYEGYRNGSSETRTRHEHVQRTLCRATAGVAGETRVERRGCGDGLRLHDTDNLQVGGRPHLSGNENAAHACQAIWPQKPKGNTRRKIIELFSQSPIDLFIQPAIMQPSQQSTRIKNTPRVVRLMRQISQAIAGFFNRTSRFAPLNRN